MKKYDISFRRSGEENLACFSMGKAVELRQGMYLKVLHLPFIIMCSESMMHKLRFSKLQKTGERLRGKCLR